MKKITFLIAFIISFILSPLSFANNVNTTLYNYNNKYGEKFTFVERGISFTIFQNGEFDFYINPRNDIHANIDLGVVNVSYNSGYNYDRYVQYDDYGAIIQIENIPIYYDHYGRIIRAGDVRIRYHSNRLVRVGGLHVYYNNYGYYSHYSGFINIHNRHYAYHPYHSYFVRPYYNHCVVSYNPYRRYYSPYRYDYYYGQKNYYSNYYKNTRNNKTFRKIDSRVRTANTDKSYKKRSDHSSRIARNSSTFKSQRSGQLNNSKPISRSNAFVKKQITKRNVQSKRNRTLVTDNRAGQNVRKERSISPQKRNVAYRNKPTKSAKNNKIVQRSSGKNIKPKTRKTVVSKKSTRTPSKKSVAQSRDRNKRKNS